MVEIANVTPPVGFNLYVIQGVSGLSLGTVSFAAWPFVFMLLLAATIITIFPQIALWLPRLFYAGS